MKYVYDAIYLHFMIDILSQLLLANHMLWCICHILSYLASQDPLALAHQQILSSKVINKFVKHAFTMAQQVIIEKSDENIWWWSFLRNMVSSSFDKNP